jgi:hypothetical protein
MALSLGTGLGLTSIAVDRSPDILTPQVVAMFAGGKKGVMYDVSNASKCITTSAGSTPTSADGDPIGKLVDLSPNAIDAIQATAGNRPLRSTITGYPYAEFGQQFMQTGLINLTGVSKVTVVLAVEKISDKNIAFIAEFSPNIDANVGAFYVTGPNGTGASSQNFGFAVHGATQTTSGVLGSRPAPEKRVIRAVYDVAGAANTDRLKAFMDGVSSTISMASTGDTSAALGNFNLNIAARLGGTLPAAMRLYRLLVIEGDLSASDALVAEAWARAALPPTSPSTRVLVLGDSTTALFNGYHSVPHFMPGIAPNLLAVPGETNDQQKARLNSVGIAHPHCKRLVLRDGP